MIDFYDLIEESNEMKLSNYTLEILNEMNNIINEKSESFTIVNENAFSTIWNKIKTFFKKIGEFIKKWWNKFLKFIGISDKDEKDDNPPDSGKVNKDAEEVIKQKKEEENKSEQSTVDNNNTTTDDTDNIENTTDGIDSEPNIDSNNNGKKESETMEENLKNDKSEFEIKYDELIDAAKEKFTEGVNSTHQQGIDSDIFDIPEYSYGTDIMKILYKLYSFRKPDIFLKELNQKEKRYELYKYCLNNSENNDFYLINVSELKDKIMTLINPNSSIHGNFYRILVKYKKKMQEFDNLKRNYTEENAVTFINELCDILNEMNSNKETNIDIDYSKMIVKISSTNNYYILRYSIQTSLIVFDNITEEFHSSETNKIDLCKSNLTKIVNELKDKNFDKNNDELLNKLVNLNLAFTNKVNNHYMNLSKTVAEIQSKINNCNKDVIFKYMTGAGLTVRIGKMNFH